MAREKRCFDWQALRGRALELRVNPFHLKRVREGWHPERKVEAFAGIRDMAA